MADTAADIIKGLRAGSAKAQHELLERYGRRVFSQILTMVQRPEEAEEVYQDVFVSAFSHIRQYEEAKASLVTWLSRIAYNKSVDHLRRRRMPLVRLDDCGGEPAVSEEEAEQTLGHPDRETVQLIRAALRQLPPHEQAIVTMFYYDDMSLREIAYVTGSIPTTVASRLSRIRKKLCQIINNIRL